MKNRQKNTLRLVYIFGMIWLFNISARRLRKKMSDDLINRQGVISQAILGLSDEWSHIDFAEQILWKFDRKDLREIINMVMVLVPVFIILLIGSGVASLFWWLGAILIVPASTLATLIFRLDISSHISSRSQPINGFKSSINNVLLILLLFAPSGGLLGLILELLMRSLDRFFRY